MKFKVELTALGKIQHARAVEDLDIEEARYYTRGLFTDLYLQYVGVQRGMGSYPAAVIQVTCGGKFSTTLTFTRPVSSSRYLSWELEAQFVHLVYLDKEDNKAKVIPFHRQDPVTNDIYHHRHPTRIFVHQNFSYSDAHVFIGEINTTLQWEVWINKEDKGEIVPTYVVAELGAHHPTRSSWEIGKSRPVAGYVPNDSDQFGSHDTHGEAQDALQELLNTAPKR